MSKDFEIKFDWTAIEKLETELKREFEREAAIDVLFSSAFMQEYTAYPSFQEMLSASPLADRGIDELAEAFESPGWDDFVNASTRFPTWEAMKSAAADLEARRRQGN